MMLSALQQSHYTYLNPFIAVIKYKLYRIQYAVWSNYIKQMWTTVYLYAYEYFLLSEGLIEIED